MQTSVSESDDDVEKQEEKEKTVINRMNISEIIQQLMSDLAGLYRQPNGAQKVHI